MMNDLISRLRLTWRLLQDNRIPLWTRSIPVLVAIYVISPVDLIPDVPIIGWIDDVAVLMGGLRLFESLVPDYIIYEHRAALGMEMLES